MRRLAAALVVVLGCGGPDTDPSDASTPPPDSDCGPSVATVARVIDGDTIELSTGERVRYLMVDAPEITGGRTDCYGAEAREFNDRLVKGKEVELRYDTECSDQFGRLLAYVQISGREVNSELIRQGYACVLFIPPNGADRRDEFESLEFEARSLDRGLWNEAACEEVTCD